MRIPKGQTIHRHYVKYAEKAGFVVHPVHDYYRVTVYNLFDVTMGYYTHRNISKNVMVGVIIDTLHQKKARIEREKVGK